MKFWTVLTALVAVCALALVPTTAQAVWPFTPTTNQLVRAGYLQPVALAPAPAPAAYALAPAAPAPTLAYAAPAVSTYTYYSYTHPRRTLYYGVPATALPAPPVTQAAQAPAEPKSVMVPQPPGYQWQLVPNN